MLLVVQKVDYKKNNEEKGTKKMIPPGEVVVVNNASPMDFTDIVDGEEDQPMGLSKKKLLSKIFLLDVRKKEMLARAKKST